MSDTPAIERSSVGPVPMPNGPKQSGPFGWFTVLSLLGIGGVLVALLLPDMGRRRDAARHAQCRNNLKQIALALNHYAEHYDAFPPAYTVDAYGNPLHSWRTLILPYLDQKPLYEANGVFRRAEPRRLSQITDRPSQTLTVV